MTVYQNKNERVFHLRIGVNRYGCGKKMMFPLTTGKRDGSEPDACKECFKK